MESSMAGAYSGSCLDRARVQEFLADLREVLLRVLNQLLYSAELLL
jgi:hypothetical protein